jgi:hypothetical protein
VGGGSDAEEPPRGGPPGGPSCLSLIPRMGYSFT